MTGYFLISIYTGLHMINVLPSLYTSKIPHNYIELINEAETGKEQPEDGVFKYELYETAYKELIEKINEED